MIDDPVVKACGSQPFRLFVPLKAKGIFEPATFLTIYPVLVAEWAKALTKIQVEAHRRYIWYYMFI